MTDSNTGTPLTSIILPAYNEKENLKLLIAKIETIMGDRPFEVVVVDDNSPDGTVGALSFLANEKPWLKVLLRTKNRGLANSIRDGLLKARGEYLVVMDSDGNHKVDHLPFMLNSLEFYDCVTASRFQYGGGMESPFRSVMSWVFNIFVRIATSGMITDSLYGFWATRRSALFSVDFDLIFWGYGDYCIRLFYYLQRKNITILQFPALNGRRVHGSGNSRLLKVFIQYFREVMKLAWRNRFHRKLETRALK